MYQSLITWQWQEELNSLWSQLEISSCYGQEAFRQQPIYKEDNKLALSLVLDEITALMTGLRENPAMSSVLIQFFQMLPDIQNELSLLKSGYVLRHEGYFQLKRFLLAHEKFEKEVFPWLTSLSIKSVEPLRLTNCLEILDPSGQRLPTFFLDGNFSEKLAEIRGLKRRIEQRLRVLQEENDLIEWTERRNEVLGVETKEEERVLLALKEHLSPYVYDWQQYLKRLGALELLLAKARLAFRKDLVRPTISEDASLRLYGLRHPIVEEILRKKSRSYMPIDLECSSGVTVITGANMGGKSVTLRAVIMNCLLFQLGYFVFAKEAHLPLFEHLTLLDEARQSIRRGMSSFAMEICQLQQHLNEQKGKFGLLVLDEFGRSTNPQEGAALMQAVTRYLQHQGGIALIATHYDGVAEEAGAHYQVRGFNHLSMEQIHQAFERDTDTMLFLQEQMDYRIEPASGQRSVPQEARLICRAFQLEYEIMKCMENKITKRNP